ncbi:hypothetical protein TIFTF001_038445 [Ficus carica]|uniref:NB-ARC domain-containing protein n=1 Tax=Ficus carica TaxID=3494 RepID=A0AA88J9Y1_FICCA|nr:hypothetical protein TIFTF001_038445 [Ficus carica]
MYVYDISKYDDEIERASKLYAELSKTKRCVLILDEVGIPEPSPQNGSKFILITRLLKVCHGMSCKAIPMERLSEMESLNLFLDTVGRDVLSMHPKHGRSLKGIVDYNNWKTALEDLKASTKGQAERNI